MIISLYTVIADMQIWHDYVLDIPEQPIIMAIIISYIFFEEHVTSKYRNGILNLVEL